MQIHAKGFDSKKKYKLGFTWWDFAGIRQKQTVRVTSVDGEIDKKVLSDVVLPNFKNNKEMFESLKQWWSICHQKHY